jgi:hypothetical protein
LARARDGQAARLLNFTKPVAITLLAILHAYSPHEDHGPATRGRPGSITACRE